MLFSVIIPYALCIKLNETRLVAMNVFSRKCRNVQSEARFMEKKISFDTHEYLSKQGKGDRLLYVKRAAIIVYHIPLLFLLSNAFSLH